MALPSEMSLASPSYSERRASALRRRWAAGKLAGMKSLTEQLWFEVPGRRGFVNITETVAKLVRKSGVQEGLCLVNAMHITASVFINDAEPG